MTGMVTETIPDDLPSVKSYLNEVREETLRLHEEKSDAEKVLHFRAEGVDRLLISLYRAAAEGYAGKPVRAALVSQGGYGRKELCLHSDIDLLLLYEGKADEFVKFINQKMIQTLWDAGLEIGFVARSINDCRRMMDNDVTILSALIDVRYLGGDTSLVDEFQQMFRKYFSSTKNKEKFFQLKISENRERQERFGDSVYLLEPNLKEGEGGLRDFHTLYWLARVGSDGGVLDPHDLVIRKYLTEEEFTSLWEALRFIWTIRNELHRRAGRRVDQLLFDYQEPIAHWLGFDNTAQFIGVELFMQKYYRLAATVHRLTQKAIRRMDRKEPALFPPSTSPVEDKNFRLVNGGLTVASPDIFEKDPLNLLKIFDLARKLNLEIDDFAREKIEKSLSLLDEKFRASSESGAFFRKMLGQWEGLGEMLTKMNDLGVLGAFLPEFGKLHFRAQYDVYHVYTVDVHSIFAVSELGKLLAGEYAAPHPTLTALAPDIDRKELLAFATLYHDIGKGEGKGHVEKGAPVIRASGERLGFSPTDVDVLEFLERSHLIMTHIAFRRDLEEQNLIINFAKTMQIAGRPAVSGMDLLNMLYVQTFCDVKGVNSEAMNSWRASLLEYLYLRTREVIQRGTYTKEKVSSLVSKVLDDVLAILPEKERTKCFDFFSIMSPRYLLATPPPVIVRHVDLWDRFITEPIVFETRVLEKEGLNEVTLLTWEHRSLFPKMTGLFAAHNINILGAQLNLSSRGHALQIFQVNDPEGKIISDPEKWARVERDLRAVLPGQVKIETLVDEKFRPSLFKKKAARVLPSKVEIDNDISAYYTVIDIFTSDRLGLLYQIGSVLSALGLYVDVSKISTKVDQVADTFYVKDIFGHKITSEGRLKKIHDILEQVVSEAPTPGWRPPV